MFTLEMARKSWQQENCQNESETKKLSRGIRTCFMMFLLGAVLCGLTNAYLAHGSQGNESLPNEHLASLTPSTFNTISGQENFPQIRLDTCTELREAIQSSAQPKQYGNASVAEFPYDILREEDSVLKRKARLLGMRMRILYGPEATYQGDFIDSQDEKGSRHTVTATIPLTEIWEGAVFDHLSIFSLKKRKSYVGRESMRLRIGMNPGRTLRPWFALTPYVNFGDAEGQGVGITAGMTTMWRNGASMSGELFAWRPWDEGYYTIVEDGRKHGVALAFTLPFTSRLTLNSRASYEELELGGGAKSGEQNAGHRYFLNTRASYALFHRAGAVMGHGFRDNDLWNEYLVGSELGIFMQVDFQRYFRPDGFDAFNPVPKVFAQEAGFFFQYAFSPHIGLATEAIIGRDPDRDLQFGEIAGMKGSLIVVVNPNLRIQAGASYMKTSTVLESFGGEERIVSLDIHYSF